MIVLPDGTPVSWVRYGKLRTGVIESSDERGAMVREEWVDPYSHNLKQCWTLVSWDRLQSGHRVDLDALVYDQSR